MRIEGFIEAASGRKLTPHRAEDAEAYLCDLGASGGLSGRQFRPPVDAIQILFVTVQTPRLLTPLPGPLPNGRGDLRKGV